MSSHKKAVHQNRRQYWSHVTNCNFNTQIHADLTEHLQNSHNDPKTLRPFECSFPECSYRTAGRSALNKQIDAFHNPNRATNASCPLCSKWFYNKYDLQFHITGVHTKQASYNCPTCEFVARYYNSWTLHYQKEHGGGLKFKCELCEYRTHNQYLLNSHKINAHVEQRKFSCDHTGCGYKTNSATVLRTHALIHERKPEGQFLFPCNFPGCDFQRRCEGEMERHRKLHQRSKREYRCEHCPKKCYPDEYSLRFHQCLVHSKTSSKCSMCEFVSSGKASLKSHIRLCHSNYRSAGKGRQVGYELKHGSNKSPGATSQQAVRSCKEYSKIPVVALKKIRVKVM